MFGDIGKAFSGATNFLGLGGGGSGLLGSVFGGGDKMGMFGLGGAPISENRFFDAQQAFIKMLQDQAAVQQQGPSEAQLLLKQSQDQAAAQGRSQALSQRGVNPGVLARVLARAGEQAQLGAGRDAALLRVKEQQGDREAQLQAQQLLAQSLGNFGQTDSDRNKMIADQDTTKATNRLGFTTGILEGGSKFIKPPKA